MEEFNSVGMVKLRDIARETGMSVSTVSRVIKNKGEISPATRDKVMAVAASLGYCRNRVNNSIRSGRTNTIGVMMGLGGLYCMALLRALHDEIARRDCLPVLAAGDQNDPATLRRLLEQRVDGILLYTQNDAATDERFSEVAARGLPLVSLDRQMPAHIDFVGTDDYAGGAAAAEYLWRRGHREMGFLQGGENLSSARLRLAGFRDFCAGRTETTLTVLGNGANDIASMRGIIAAAPHLTAIAAFNDDYAYCAFAALHERGLSVPGDVSLLGFANYSALGAPEYPGLFLNSFDQQIEEIASRAVEQLFARRENPRLPQAEIRVTPVLIERGSVCDV